MLFRVMIMMRNPTVETSLRLIVLMRRCPIRQLERFMTYLYRQRRGVFTGERLGIRAGIIRPEGGKQISAGKENGKLTRSIESYSLGFFFFQLTV
ncbi:hypothetical protein OIU84_003309 [Salix udensis]|uniref:Uncharacterized protein n=1 Tax=Salix udensis TaxID=889485 RepID=A0AAD6K647_9ROSI|nr:hypothetical protein OIU84_003309 [Salix udensis]